MKNIIKFLLISFAFTALYACEEKEELTPDPYTVNWVYVKPPVNNATSFTFSETGYWKIPLPELQIVAPIRCTKPAKQDISVSVKIDESLVEKYNTENQTEYLFFPGAKLQKADFVIKAGEYLSADTIKVVYPNPDLIVEGGTADYVLPITIESVSGPAQESEKGTFYLVYNAEVKFAEVVTGYTGTIVEDRSGWTVTHNDRDVTSRVCDGSTWTDITVSVNDIVKIDLGKEYNNVCNFGLHYYYHNYIPADFTIEISSDDVDYKNIGTYSSTSEKQIVDFYSPLQAVRYIKYTIGESLTGYRMYLAEVYIATLP